MGSRVEDAKQLNNVIDVLRNEVFELVVGEAPLL